MQNVESFGRCRDSQRPLRNHLWFRAIVRDRKKGRLPRKSVTPALSIHRCFVYSHAATDGSDGGFSVGKPLRNSNVKQAVVV